MTSSDSPHAYLSTDRWNKDYYVLQCVNGWLKIRLWGKLIPTSRLVSINPDNDPCWYHGTFEDGGTCKFEPLEYVTYIRFLNKDETYQDDFVLPKLIRAGLIKNINADRLEAAITAKLKLEQAKEEYRRTLEALGATKQERGSYPDYDVWYGLPDAPTIHFDFE